MTDKLLPCPCGRLAVMEMTHSGDQDPSYFVRCEDDYNCWHGPIRDTEDGAAAAWSRRAGGPELTPHLEPGPFGTTPAIVRQGTDHEAALQLMHANGHALLDSGVYRRALDCAIAGRIGARPAEVCDYADGVATERERRQR